MSPLKAFFGHNEVFVRVILYPFPFAIVRKALSRMIKVAGEANLINSFNPTANDPTVTHDASAICRRHTFCTREEDQVMNIIAILRCFKAVYGLKVNLFKSAPFGIIVVDHLIEGLVDIMGCKVELSRPHV